MIDPATSSSPTRRAGGLLTATQLQVLRTLSISSVALPDGIGLQELGAYKGSGHSKAVTSLIRGGYVTATSRSVGGKRRYQITAAGSSLLEGLAALDRLASAPAG